MPDPTLLQNGLNPETPTFQDKPSDMIPQNQSDPGIDEEDLRNRVLELFQNDIRDKEEFGWVEKRSYDIAAYYGLKNRAMMNWPWPNASAFPQPLTPTLIDTGHANILASMYSNVNKLVRVKGIGREDIRKAPILESLMNWQLSTEVDMYSVQDANVFRTFIHGTGILKVMQDFNKNMVNPVSVDIENIYLPLDATGCQVEDTDHIFHAIPLSYNDIQYRKSIQVGGKPVYRDLDEIAPGAGINNSLTREQLEYLRDIASGTSMTSKMRRDTYWLLECYLTYFQKNAASGPSGPMRGLKSKELITWISPNGGKIQRVIENKEGIRPFADYHIYPNYGRFWSMSLPEKIRNEQEKLDYADKQNTDALDRAISPAGFFDEGMDFDPDVSQRVPGGMYPKPRDSKIDWEPNQYVNPGFERQLDYCWDLAERKTGLTELFQGRQGSRTKTLGEAELRSNRAEVRFSTLFDRFGYGWKKTCQLVYFYDDKFIDRTKKVKVIGYADYKSIDELFPKTEGGSQGLQLGGNYDFEFGGSPVTEIEKQKQDDVEFCLAQMTNPIVINNPANLWRVTEKMAQARGIENVETIITKPSEANIMSAQEAIERIVSGQTDILPRPGIDLANYLFEIQLFAKTETFQTLDPPQKQALQVLFQRVQAMQQAAMQAQHDLQILQAGAIQAGAAGHGLPMPPGPMGPGGPPPGGPAPAPSSPGTPTPPGAPQ